MCCLWDDKLLSNGRGHGNVTDFFNFRPIIISFVARYFKFRVLINNEEYYCKNDELPLKGCIHSHMMSLNLRKKVTISRNLYGLSASKARNILIFVNFDPPEAPKLTNRRARGPGPPACKYYRRNVPTKTSR